MKYLLKLADFLEAVADLIRAYQGLREQNEEIRFLEEIENEGRIQGREGQA